MRSLEVRLKNSSVIRIGPLLNPDRAIKDLMKAMKRKKFTVLLGPTELYYINGDDVLYFKSEVDVVK